MNIELKPLNYVDPTQLAYFANDRRVSQYLRNSFPYPYTVANALSFIQFSIQNHQLDFGIFVDNICVGCISATFQKDIYQNNCEIGYWLGYEYWNKGIMSHVVCMMVQYLFENYSIHKIYAEIYAHNIASAHVLEKNGFVKEAHFKEHIFKNGSYYDAEIYSLLQENKK